MLTPLQEFKMGLFRGKLWDIMLIADWNGFTVSSQHMPEKHLHRCCRWGREDTGNKAGEEYSGALWKSVNSPLGTRVITPIFMATCEQYKLILSFSNLWKQIVQPSHSGFFYPHVLGQLSQQDFSTLSRLWSPHTLNRCRCEAPSTPVSAGSSRRMCAALHNVSGWKTSGTVVAMYKHGQFKDGIKVDQRAELHLIWQLEGSMALQPDREMLCWHSTVNLLQCIEMIR